MQFTQILGNFAKILGVRYIHFPIRPIFHDNITNRFLMKKKLLKALANSGIVQSFIARPPRHQPVYNSPLSYRGHLQTRDADYYGIGCIVVCFADYLLHRRLHVFQHMEYHSSRADGFRLDVAHAIVYQEFSRAAPTRLRCSAWHQRLPTAMSTAYPCYPTTPTPWPKSSSITSATPCFSCRHSSN